MESPLSTIKKHICGNSGRLILAFSGSLLFLTGASFLYPPLITEGEEAPLGYLHESRLELPEVSKDTETNPLTAPGEGEELLSDEDDTYSLSAGHNLDMSTFVSYDEKVDVFDKKDWRLILVNKQHPIPEDYTFEQGTIKGYMTCDERIIADLMLMLSDAKEQGVNLVIRSPYRDSQRQEYLFNRKLDSYMDKDMSYMEAYRVSSQAVTVPGSSEHQIGLALDITAEGYPYLNEGFANTPEGMWLAEHCHEYGFTIRYPAGKEYITSIEYEPWHFRYVGRDAAKVMYEEGLCLEEFVERL